MSGVLPNLVAKYRANLKSLRGIYIDCGWRLLSQGLAEAGIRYRYEEFDHDHSDIDYRMHVSLPFLYRAGALTLPADLLATEVTSM